MRALRFVAFLTFFFLFFSTIEAWAGYWLVGRWFVSSRFAYVTLGTVKSWLDRGIITSTTRQAKVFINRYGKWILLTLGLSYVIQEVYQRMQASQYCYLPNGYIDLVISSGRGSTTISYDAPNFVGYTVSCSGRDTCTGASYHYRVPRFYLYRGNVWRGEFPQPGTYVVSDGCMSCTFNIYWKVELSQCGSSSQEWQNERRQVPVRVYPNPADFLRNDVIENDPALRWLRDEYQRISSDSSIPTVPSDALVGLELPDVDWVINPDEALDFPSERGSTREGSREGVREGENQDDIPVPDVPGLDTNLPLVDRRPFPVELINSIVQNHPLLRVLQGVRLDVGGGGSCVFGSQPFVIDMCNWQWVFNTMGAFLVPLAFLYGLGIGRSEE